MAQSMMPSQMIYGGHPAGFPMQMSSGVQWVVTADEKKNYEAQFDKLMPVGGFVRGDQARAFFLQSNLPANTLAQIWELADFTNDGKMDRLEFAIAMKLIKLKLQGIMLPTSLPSSMKQSVAGGFGIGVATGGSGGNMMPTYSSSVTNGTSSTSSIPSNGMSSNMMSAATPASAGMTSSLSRNNSLNDNSMRTSSSQEWGIPKSTKLKYNQLFNSNDRTKTGFLSGMQARNLLSNTGLPHMTLAQIWQLSDIDGDGQLTQEEFVLAMHLADIAKSGNPVPAALPPHLIPPSYKSAKLPPQQQPQVSGQLGLLTPLGAMDQQPTAGDVSQKEQDTSVFASFEDRRRDNFQKGNLELEKRRQALLESQQRERERVEQKEREQREKREKERMEQERKKQEKVERQLEQQRAIEREREEQRRKAVEQKEAAQREMERQRQLEWERLRRKELLQHKIREQESVTSLRAKTKTLDVELNSLEEKKVQLSARETEMEQRISETRKQLADVNRQRELQQTLVQKQHQQVEQLNVQVNTLMPGKQELSERLQFKKTSSHDEGLQSAQRDLQSKVFAVQSLQASWDEMEKQKLSSSAQLEQLNGKLNELREELNRMTLTADNMNRKQQDKIRELQEARRQKDITINRKNSMERNQKLQEKLATSAMMQKQEMDTRVQEEMARQEQLKRNEEEERKRRALEDENDRMKRKEEEERKKAAADDEAKRAEVKRKITAMQQERRKQKHQTAAADAKLAQEQTAALQLSGSVVAGFKLKLSQDPANLFTYRALYNFTARNPDELSLQSGDVITVDESQDVEPDWLAGMKDGKAGWFPANYVEKVLAASKPATKTPSPAPTSTSKQDLNLTPNHASAFSIASTNPAAVTHDAGAGQKLPQQLSAPKVARYRAVYPWIAKKENHLSFEQGDIIAVSEQQEMWWFGHCKGKTGWFPKAYVKAVSSTTPVNAKPASPNTSPQLKRKAPSPPGGSSAASTQEYVASFTFTGTESGDLSFDTGDVIAVTSTNGEWWTGTLRGKTGIFPANYVTPKKTTVQMTPAATTADEEATEVKTKSAAGKPEVATVIAAYQASGAEQLSLQVGQLVSVRKKTDRGWWEGELQVRGKKRQIGWFPANYVKLMTSAPPSGKSHTATLDAANARPTTSMQQRVTALYDYSAQNPDELSFRQGQTIVVQDRSDADWWKGSLESGQSGLFPSNYVSETRSQSTTPIPDLKGTEYYRRVMELINSEESYLKDLELADNEFQQPLRKKKLLSEQEVRTLFVNLNELVMCSAKLARAFRVRCKMTDDEDQNSLMIGDILCEQIPNLHPYIRFCSCQLNASTLLQVKLDNNPDFKTFVKACESGDHWKGLPVSSYLVKPMQRVTKYPLLIKKIHEHTPESHPDRRNLSCALEKAEELCRQVNEGVREKENSDRLEWLQTHVHIDGLQDKLVFNSKTNCLDQRRFLHCGTLYKHKSSKELVGFLFNDFLMLTTPIKPLNMQANERLFSAKTNVQFRMYKNPVFLNEILTRIPPDAEEPIFHLSHIDHIYMLRTDSAQDRSTWIKKITDARDIYIETEKKKREKAYQARTQRSAGIGRLMVTIVEGCNLVKTSNGRHDPYCEVTMGEQCHTTKTMQDTLNPKWTSTMQFFVRNLDLDVLCISVFQRDMFSPDDFLGRTEVKLSDVHRDVTEQATKGPICKRLLLHEVDAGEVVVKLDLLLYDKTVAR